MAAPQIITELVERFRNNFDSYKSSNYNETQVRREFIDPFFEALGWDVSNKLNFAEAYKDVVHEYSQKTKDNVQAPDYLFKYGGIRKFFVEAKKPSVNLKDDPNPAFQVRRYAWSAKLTLSVLTDFEEFIVYDCRIKPKINDKPSTGRIFYYSFEDYLDKWDEIYSIFSKDAVLKGSFDRFAESKKNKKGTAEVDDEFLSEIENWRNTLAKNIALRNTDLSNRELNFSVQKTIDRIIFLRICEDRGIEDYGQLMNLLNGANSYKRLLQIFTKADEKYNSGLFYFNEEKGRSDYPDTLTHKLFIDDKVIKDIIKNLYYPESPYEFSVLPADILGHVYEQFLGKVIRLTPGHRAIVEEKPEVKKAGGVYYTPTYIVDYIVKNTLGTKLNEIYEKHKNNLNAKSINKIQDEVSKIKVLDPACGSGSFLLGAYQYLIDWHLNLYNEIYKDGNLTLLKSSPVYISSANELKLTTAERKRILLNNIFGVDIDSQAVEVTKLSLMLKVLEGETEETLSSQLNMFHQRALPDLGNNIKCGNSLIGPDFYDQMDMNFLDDEEKYRINVFDWESEFKDIFKSGGFDVVIGNPPWIFTKYVDWGELTKNYIQNKYLKTRNDLGSSLARQAGKINLYAIFLLRGMALLNANGYFSNIVPNTILRTTVYDIIRFNLLTKYKIISINDHGTGVFKGVTASTTTIVIENEQAAESHQIKIFDFIPNDKNNSGYINELHQKSCLLNTSYVIDIFTDQFKKKLILKLDEKSVQLGKLLSVYNGIATFKNKAGIQDKKINEFSKPLIMGKDIERYNFTWSGKYIQYVREELQRPRDENIFLSKEKLIMQRIGGILITAYDENQFYTFNSVNNLIPNPNNEYDLKYFLAILNSKLLRFYYISKFTNNSNLTVNISKTFLDELPIKMIDMDNEIQKNIYERIINNSKFIVDSLRAISTSSTPQEKQNLQRQIDAADKQIDKLVYELYGLTEEEIKIVEGEN